MAEASKRVVVEDAMERMWIHSSCIAKRDQVIRSRTKEATGSPVWVIRGQELEQLNALIVKFS